MLLLACSRVMLPLGAPTSHAAFPLTRPSASRSRVAKFDSMLSCERTFARAKGECAPCARVEGPTPTSDPEPSAKPPTPPLRNASAHEFDEGSFPPPVCESAAKKMPVETAVVEIELRLAPASGAIG